MLQRDVHACTLKSVCVYIFVSNRWIGRCDGARPKSPELSITPYPLMVHQWWQPGEQWFHMRLDVCIHVYWIHCERCGRPNGAGHREEVRGPVRFLDMLPWRF